MASSNSEEQIMALDDLDLERFTAETDQHADHQHAGKLILYLERERETLLRDVAKARQDTDTIVGQNMALKGKVTEMESQLVAKQQEIERLTTSLKAVVQAAQQAAYAAKQAVQDASIA